MTYERDKKDEHTESNEYFLKPISKEGVLGIWVKPAIDALMWVGGGLVTAFLN